MIEAVAVQVERASAAARHSPHVIAIAQATGRERAGPLRESPRAGEPSGPARPSADKVPPSGLIDKEGLLSAQSEETEEEKERRKDPQNLTEEERAIVKELQARDREVRAHEQAHARVGGQHAGSPSYTYENGPDGKRYAVSGQVKIDVSPVRGDPEATIRKMEQVKKAALAPAEPSAEDRAVAAKADAVKAQARAELAQQRAQEQREARDKGEEDQATAASPEPEGKERGSVATPEDGDGEASVTGQADAARLGRAHEAYGRIKPGTPRGFGGAADPAHILSLVA